MDNINSSYKFISSLYENLIYTNKRTPKQEKIRQEYLEELKEQLNNYKKEKNTLLMKCSELETNNVILEKKINYYANKLQFKNIRYSSTANFISLTVNPLNKKLHIIFDTYNKNNDTLILLYDSIKNIDSYIYNTEFNINYYFNSN
jgi:hypothetical protein